MPLTITGRVGVIFIGGVGRSQGEMSREEECGAGGAGGGARLLPRLSATLMAASSWARLLTETWWRRSPQGLMKTTPLSFHVPMYWPKTVPTASCLTGMTWGSPQIVSGQQMIPRNEASGVVQQKHRPSVEILSEANAGATVTSGQGEGVGAAARRPQEGKGQEGNDRRCGKKALNEFAQTERIGTRESLWDAQWDVLRSSVHVRAHLLTCWRSQRCTVGPRHAIDRCLIRPDGPLVQ